jgi:hypothetical protein
VKISHIKQEILVRTNCLFSLIRHGDHKKRRVQQFFYCQVCIRCSGNVFTEPLRSNDSRIHSTVTLRVVIGDEKGSLKSKTVKYGIKSQGTRTRERLRWQEPAAYTRERPDLSSERGPQMGLDTKDLLTD